MQVYFWFQLWTGGKTPKSYKANWPAPGSVSPMDQSTNLTNTWRQTQLYCIATHSDPSTNCMGKDSSPKECTKAEAALLSHSLRTENISNQDNIWILLLYCSPVSHTGRCGHISHMVIHFHNLGTNAHTLFLPPHLSLFRMRLFFLMCFSKFNFIALLWFLLRYGKKPNYSVLFLQKPSHWLLFLLVKNSIIL